MIVGVWVGFSDQLDGWYLSSREVFAGVAGMGHVQVAAAVDGDATEGGRLGVGTDF